MSTNLQYTGVNLSGLEFGSGIGSLNTTYAMPPSSEYSYWAQNVGSNIIRLPFTWERLQPTSGGALDPTYLSYIQQEVNYAKANGQTIILDLHNYGLYNGQPATATQLSNVWTQLGQVFKNDSNVWFDIMNEPNNIAATSWESVEQQAVNALRANGIDNKVLLEGTSWSGAWTWTSSGNAAAFANFKDSANNYAYDVHQYLDSDGSGTSATAVTGSGSTRLVDITNWAASSVQKLFLGEAGLANNSGSETEVTAMINYMQQHNNQWLGYTLWGAGPWWPSNYIYNINPTGSGTSTTNEQSIQDLMSLLSPASGTTGSVNQPPVANLDAFTGTQNHTITGNVITNDTDPNGAALSVTAATITTAHGGTVVQNANGTFTYTPVTGFTGTDTYNYTLKDSAGLSSTGAVTFTVNASTPTQSTPVANPDSFTAQQYHSISGNVMTNDTDPNGLALSVTAAQLTTARGGTVILNANGTFTYTPVSSFYGADSFTYTLKDSAGLSATGTANINVNAAPVAHPDDFTATENIAITGNVLADNGHGADSDPIAATTLSVSAATLTTVHGGQASLMANGSFTYTPASGYTGTDSFNYTLLDGRGGQAIGTADITVTAPSTSTPPPVTTSLTVNGTAGNDTLNADHTIGTTINGGGGNDYIIGHDGSDVLNGGDGNDLISGYYGNDTLAGGTGSDTLIGGPGKDTFVFNMTDLGTGVDKITDFSASQGDKIDISNTLQGHYTTASTLSNFVAITTSGSNSILSVDLDGSGQHWTGVAVLTGVTGLNVQQLVSNGNLILLDTTSSSGSTSSPPPTTSLTVNGTSGNDTLNADHDIGTIVNGLGGNDYISGHNGNDVLNGGDGNDLIYGYYGNDTLAGGTGSDTLAGGPGADMFLFKAADLGTGADLITDFSAAQGDKINISDILSGHYNPATNVLSNFVHITTSGSNSILSVDTNGSAGAHGWTAVATISGVTGLDENTLAHNGNLIV